MILVARRGDKLRQTCQTLKDRGFSDVLGLPVVTLTPLKPTTPRQAKGVIITSSAAVPALEGCSLPCYTVGEKTAEAARRAGLDVKHSGKGNAENLSLWLQENINPQEQGVLWHPSTKEAVNEWYTILEKAGIKVLFTEAYKTTYLLKLPHEVVCCLKENKVSSLLVFSAKGAEKTLALLKAHGFAPAQFKTVAAISENVAKTLRENGVESSSIRVAKNPLSEDLINVLEQPTL